MTTYCPVTGGFSVPVPPFQRMRPAKVRVRQIQGHFLDVTQEVRG